MSNNHLHPTHVQSISPMTTSSSSPPPSTLGNNTNTASSSIPSSITSSSTTTNTATTQSSIPSSYVPSNKNNSHSSHNSSMKEKVYIWDWDVHQVKTFLQKTSLFAINTTSSSNNDDDNDKIKNEYNQQLNTANILLSNICNALQSASIDPNHHLSNTTTTTNDPNRNLQQSKSKRDLYHILDSSFSQGKDVVHKPGAILSRLTINGYINALAGQIGGIADTQLLTEPTLLSNTNTNQSHNQLQQIPPLEKTTPIPTASNLNFHSLSSQASSISHSIQSQLEMDMLESTPTRIINLLCPELTLSQIASIRHRVVETVIHGRGTNTSNFLLSLEDDKDVPTMAKTTMAQHTHEINKFKRCPVCGNNDQGAFVLDKKNGDVICTSCGTVISESLMHEGSMYRKFEGEEDRNHHGDVNNPLFSNAYNTATSLSGVSISVGAGIGGYGSSGRATSGNIETILKRVHNYTELNISQMGKEEKKTRIGYKDRQKKEAFVQMNHVGDALSLHTAVLQRAKELFSGFRDDRELLQQFKGVIAACLCEAFDQLSNEGRQILKLQISNGEGGGDSVVSSKVDEGTEGSRKGKHEKTEINSRNNKYGSNNGIAMVKKEKLNARASRRNELHSSNLAGKGGLKLNLPQKRKYSAGDEKKIDDGSGNKNQNGGKRTPKNPTTLDIEVKPVTKWNLDDARNWLLEASRIIARKWFDQQDEAGKPGSTVGDIPKGTADEIEGNLVQYSLKLCNVLEIQMKKSASRADGKKLGGMNSKRKVKTPRVNDLGSLSIKWQHKHERGSGGAGGVGFSGSGAANILPHLNGTKSKTLVAIKGKVDTVTSAGNSTKTAGQILRMKTASQLKKDIGDVVAGDAFYKELRALLGRQDAKAKLERSEEASIRRMNQMKRKPELQARVQL